MFSVVINTKRWKLEFLFQEKFKDVPCSSLDSDAAAENTKINIYVLQVTFTEQMSEHETRQGFKDHHSPADSTAIHLWSIRMIKKQSCVFKNGGTRWKIMNTSYQQPVKLKCFLTGKKDLQHKTLICFFIQSGSDLNILTGSDLRSAAVGQEVLCWHRVVWAGSNTLNTHS